MISTTTITISFDHDADNLTANIDFGEGVSLSDCNRPDALMALEMMEALGDRIENAKVVRRG